MRLEFSRQTFEKCPNIKFHEKPSSGSRVVAYRRADRHDKAVVVFGSFGKAHEKRFM
jgi:hypothetical protein